ncbi:MAG: YggS family pyridoxal phosphate-dependent enzyme [Synergistaceae bacterium]|nr:YggS family pyridoxal phosphate-dependent enzyme [Synergistaceae bacterium]
MVNIKDNLTRIRDEIRTAAKRSGRIEEDILLVAVTKTRPVEDIIEAVQYGITTVGENRVQELLEKKAGWPENISVQWRLIGHLQKNKIRKVFGEVSAIDSVDSLDLAKRLSAEGERTERVLPVLVEINTSGETSKKGLSLEEALPVLENILGECPFLAVEGLMTIGPLTENEAQVRRAFACLRELAEKARRDFSLPLPELSMGMSGDFSWAIEEGSTMVRIGSALFGVRRGI